MLQLMTHIVGTPFSSIFPLYIPHCRHRGVYYVWMGYRQLRALGTCFRQQLPMLADWQHTDSRSGRIASNGFLELQSTRSFR